MKVFFGCIKVRVDNDFSFYLVFVGWGRFFFFVVLVRVENIKIR